MKENLRIKEVLYASCIDFIEDRLETIQRTINDIQGSLTSETKSSAGDKHETGRAMLQLEREKSGVQLNEIQKVLANLDGIYWIMARNFSVQGGLSRHAARER